VDHVPSHLATSWQRGNVGGCRSSQILIDAQFVARFRGHRKPIQGHKFSLGALKDDLFMGVTIVGRYVSRMHSDKMTLEATRLATDSTRNACSLLHGIVARAIFALRHARLGT
jgi:hypothetical protein